MRRLAGNFCVLRAVVEYLRTHEDHNAGSEVLPASAPTVEWKAGSVVEVSWSVMANHGGVSGTVRR